MANAHCGFDGAIARLASMSVLAFVVVLAGVPSASAAGPAQRGRAQHSAVDAALHFFMVHGAGGILEHFASVRPTPISTADRALVLATLPPSGEVIHLSPVQREKLAAVRRVLEVHDRESVYVVKVVDVSWAFVGLHARTVVLISEVALDLLDAAQLQAFVAHEIGHEYFWEEYARARRDDDRAGLRRLELLCDGLAIVTLRRAGTNPVHLTTALEKAVGYNHTRFGVPLDADRYPAIGERRVFGRRLAAWLAGGAG
jgi:hypothetical protein